MNKTIYWLTGLGLLTISASLAGAGLTSYPVLFAAVAALQGWLLGLHLAADGRQRHDRIVAERHLLQSLGRVNAQQRALRDKQYAAIGFAISEAFLAGWSASREGHNADLDGDKPFEESVGKVELDKYLDQLLEQTGGEA